MPSDSTWFGGGVFRPDGALCLRAAGNDTADAEIRACGIRLADWPPVDASPPGDRERGFDNLHWRLIRDSWRETGTGYARPTPGGGCLEKEVGLLGERHLLTGPDGAEACDASGWEWAELQGDEILYAKAGGLFRLKPGAQPRRIASIAPAPN